MNQPLNCFTIPAEKPFVNLLATWILKRFGQDAATLTGTLVLLPNRRLCRSLQEAFLECTGGKPMLLPRLQPLGEVDEELTFLYAKLPGDGPPPPLHPLRRQFLLTRLVMDFTHRQAQQERGRGYTIEQSAELAARLALFMDEAAREGIGMEGLARLVPEEFAEHWQQTLEFLTIVSHAWPAILAAENASDAAAYRNHMLRLTADSWKKHPPIGPVIAAGSTGSMPATAYLLSAIARLPAGMVVLPGLDKEMPEKEWEILGETHPQYGLKQLLATMEATRAQVQWLEEPQAQASPRADCLRAAFGPPAATAHWPGLALPLREGLEGVRLLTADTQHDEAGMIAVALREVLETPAKTAVLVTPDRTLARMVAAQLRRFSIEVDDSAGTPLKDSPAACFLRLAAAMTASLAAPAPLLSLLRHPLAAAGMDPAQCRRLSREVELKLLRGIRREPGLEALSRAAAPMPKLSRDAKTLLAALAEQEKKFAGLFHARENVPLSQLLTAHIAFAQWLASTPQEEGAQRLWQGESGEQLAAFIADCLSHAAVLPAVEPASYPGLFDILLAGQVCRPRYGRHPRLRILGPLEARLQRFDRVILGGLNEGAWPAPPLADPWMSRPMRSGFGLPAAERSIGQSAHDVYMLCMAPEVLLSRAHKVEGTPTIPSRWLVRLETLVAGLDPDFFAAMESGPHYAGGKRQLDAPAPLPPLERPSFRPPLEARPRRLRVTAVDQWASDPYLFYAAHILGLRELDAIDAEPDAADFGNVIHKAMEIFTLRFPSALPENPEAALLEAGREAFAAMIARPAVACLWWPRFEAMAPWLAAREKERRPLLSSVHAELKGEWLFDAGGPFTLTTRIDRLELLRGGAAIVGDYKTGSVPTQKEYERGERNQLALEALIVLHGTLQPAVPAPSSVTALEYWKLGGAPAKCGITAIDTGMVEAARQRLEALIRQYADPAMPYASPPGAGRAMGALEHFIRRQEWEPV